MASGSVGSIFVDLLLRDTRYSSGLNKARKQTGLFSNAIKSDIKSIGFTFASAFSVTELVRYSDTFKAMQGRLGLVTNGLMDMKVVQAGLLDVANRTRQPLADITNLYSRLVQFVPEGERGMYDFMGVVESVSSALAITGEASLSAQAALVQFTQAIGTNFQAAGQELRSLQEQAPRLTKALVDALGGGTKSLQTLKEEGKLTRESVLKALSGTSEAGRKLREEMAKIPVTIGQAFTKLDNAFLNFIGTNDNMQAGISSVTQLVTLLASNFDKVAKVAILAGTAIGVKFLAPILSTNIALIATGVDATIATVGLGRLAFGSTSASLAMTGLLGATRALNLALYTFGGPIGIAAIAVVTALTLHTNKADEAETKYIKSLQQISNNFIDFNKKSSEAKKAAIADSQARVDAIKKEVLALRPLIDEYINLAKNASVFTKMKLGALEILGKMGIGESPSEMLERLKAGQKSWIEGQRSIADKLKPATKAIEEQSDSVKELDRLYEKYQYIIEGVTKGQEKYGDAQEALAKLHKNGRITQEQMTEALKTYKMELDGTTKMSKNAAESMQSYFADFLFDPFKDGLDGMLTSFGDVIKKMLAEAEAARLAKALFGDLVEGGTGKGIVGSTLTDFFSNFSGMFANGGRIGSGEWGIVGENGPEIAVGGTSGKTIIPQSKISGSGSGIVVNVINNGNSSVSTKPGTNGADLDVIIDNKVAKLIGSKGSSSNKAMNSYNSRKLIVR